MLNKMFFLILISFVCSFCSEKIGAIIPWTTIEAEKMQTNGTVLGPVYKPYHVETESSHQRCVKLLKNDFVEFKTPVPSNTLVIRYSLPDSPQGGGLETQLALYINDKFQCSIDLTSRLSWLYGKYPFSNTPQADTVRNFYNETQLKNISINPGDVVKLHKVSSDCEYVIIDLVDLENISPPLSQPENSISLTDKQFADLIKENDYTEALRRCIEIAETSPKSVWIPAGTFTITGNIELPSNIIIQGAGMWHTTLESSDSLDAISDCRIRFIGKCSNIHLSDFAINGKLDFRNDREPNDGIWGEYGENSIITRLWIEHTKVGIWVNNCKNLTVSDCRFRNTIADGINLCVGCTGCTVQNCTARGTGDDCFAMWLATHARQTYTSGQNLFKNCTGQLPFLANGVAIYGGKSNRVENCLLTDISPGCGILLSTSFPTASLRSHINNNFSGTTTIQNCKVVRSGGFDHSWDWRAAVQLCLDRQEISGIHINYLEIVDSLSDGFSILAPVNKKDNGILSDVLLQNITIPNFGIGAGNKHGFWIRDDVKGRLKIVDSDICDIQNDSPDCIIEN